MYNKLYSNFQTSVEGSTITTGGEMAVGTLINVDAELELYIEYLRGTEMGILFVNRDCFRNDQELAKYVVDLMVFFVSWYREKFKRIDCLRSIVHCDLDVGEAMFWTRPEKTALEIMTLKYDDARMKKDEADNKLVEEKKNLKDMRRRVGELETDSSKLKRENQQLKKQKLELENENHQLKDDNQQQLGSLSTKDKQSKKLREGLRLLKVENKELKMKLEVDKCMFDIEMNTREIVLKGGFETKVEKVEGEKKVLVQKVEGEKKVLVQKVEGEKRAELEKVEGEKTILQTKLKKVEGSLQIELKKFEGVQIELKKIERERNILQTDLENLKGEKNRTDLEKLLEGEKKLESSIREVVKRVVGDLSGAVVHKVMCELPIPQVTSVLEAQNERLREEQQKTLHVLNRKTYELSQLGTELNLSRKLLRLREDELKIKTEALNRSRIWW
ncbi:hypothetical protein OROGR_028801 [Orobanche gracilis]